MTASRWRVKDPQWLAERQKSWNRIKMSLEISEKFTKKQLATYENYFIKGKIPKWYPQSEGALIEPSLWTDQFDDPIPLIIRLWLDPEQSLENWKSIIDTVLSSPHWYCIQRNLERSAEIWLEANNHISYSGFSKTPDGFMGGLEEKMFYFLMGNPGDSEFIEYHGRKFDKRRFFPLHWYGVGTEWLTLKNTQNNFKFTQYAAEHWYCRLTDEYCEFIRSDTRNIKPTHEEVFIEYLGVVAHYPQPDPAGDNFVRENYCKKIREILDNRPLPEMMQKWWQQAKATPPIAKPAKSQKAST